MIIEKAPAKINLALDVVNRRPDNYHNLHMVMTTVDLADRLSFEKIDNDIIDVSSNRHFLPNDDRNLVYRTARLMKETLNIKTGVKIFINKNIPVAAGLAGGSSDAAATIRALNKLFKLELSQKEMISIGKEIGSDVPFCVINKTAIAEERGEILTPLPKMPKCWVILVKPQYGVSTREVFENINYQELSHPDVHSVITAITKGNYELLCKSLGNSLENTTFRMYPEVSELKSRMLLMGADAALMSGSGPTVFGLTLKEAKAKRIYHSFDKTKYEVFYVRVLG